MVWVDRDGVGQVSGVCTLRQYAGQEALPDDHADVQVFRQRLAVLVAKPHADRLALKQRIRDAATMEELKTVLLDIINGGR